MCKILSLIALQGKRESALGERDSEKIEKINKKECGSDWRANFENLIFFPLE